MLRAILLLNHHQVGSAVGTRHSAVAPSLEDDTFTYLAIDSLGLLQ